MKKNIKKIIPGVIITSMLAANPIFAEELADTEVATAQEEVTEEATEVSEEAQEEVDEEVTEEVAYEEVEETEEAEEVTEDTEEVADVVVKTVLTSDLIQENGRLLFPVRYVFENLDFEVNYEPVEKFVTISRGAQYVTFNTTKDGYTFAKTAPQLLGQAPVVKEGSTYAPIELLTEIMQLEGVSVDGLKLTVTEVVEVEVIVEVEEEIIEDVEETTEVEEDAEEVMEAVKVVIEEINEEENMITINDPERGTIILNVEGLEIEYTTEDETLMVGQTIEVVYSNIMLTSEPPVNVPVSVKVVSAE